MMRWLIIPFLFLLAAFGHAETMKVVGGSADKFLLVMMIGTDGAAETGLAFGDVTITWTFNDDGSDNDVTEQTMTMGVHAEGGWIEVDSTNSPGLYQFGIPDAAIADGSEYTVFSFKATDVVPTFKTVELIDADLRDAVRLGLTALPNAAADAAGGLPISDAGGLDLDGLNTNINDIETDTAAVDTTTEMRTFLTGGDTAVSTLTTSDNIGINWADVSNPTTAVDLSATDIQLVDTASALTGHTAQTADHTAGIASIATTATAILADVTGLNGDAMRGTDSAALAATALTDATWTDARAGYLDELGSANIPANIDSIATTVTAILADTTTLPTDPADDSDIDTQLAAIDALIDIIDAIVDNILIIVQSQ